MESLSCRSANQVTTDRLKSNNNSPTIGSNLAWCKPKVVEDNFYERVERKSHLECEAFKIESEVIMGIQAHMLML